ncbi:MAG: hypothetical protein ACLFOY_13190 [Desulfatibacillaceae bacterium]
MFRKTACFLFMSAVGFTLFALPAARAAMAEFRISYGPAGSPILVEQESREKWTATEGGTKYAVTVENGRNVSLRRDFDMVASGAIEEDALVLRNPEGEFYAAVRFAGDKVGLVPEEGDDPWMAGEVTREAEPENAYEKMQAETGTDDEVEMERLILVERGGTTRGVVKHYPEVNRLKVRDNSGEVLAQMKGATRLSPVLAPFVVQDADKARRNFFMLLLFTLEE